MVGPNFIFGDVDVSWPSTIFFVLVVLGGGRPPEQQMFNFLVFLGAQKTTVGCFLLRIGVVVVRTSVSPNTVFHVLTFGRPFRSHAEIVAKASFFV